MKKAFLMAKRYGLVDYVVGTDSKHANTTSITAPPPVPRAAAQDAAAPREKTTKSPAAVKQSKALRTNSKSMKRKTPLNKTPSAKQ